MRLSRILSAALLLGFSALALADKEKPKDAAIFDDRSATLTENEGGKPGWKVEPLSGELRSGDMIVVRLHLTGPRAQYLMIEDPIPAGAEQVAQVSGIYLNYSLGQWSDWYSNREFRDNRTAIFMNYFDGDATLQYAMRVEVPGEFKDVHELFSTRPPDGYTLDDQAKEKEDK